MPLRVIEQQPKKDAHGENHVGGSGGEVVTRDREPPKTTAKTVHPAIHQLVGIFAPYDECAYRPVATACRS